MIVTMILNNQLTLDGTVMMIETLYAVAISYNEGNLQTIRNNRLSMIKVANSKDWSSRLKGGNDVNW